MENKQKAIEKAYGFLNSYLIDENGWAVYSIDEAGESGVEPFGDYEIQSEKDGVTVWRPKSLQGIETNNGWINIDEKFNWGKNNEYLIFWDSEKKESIVSLKYALCEYQDSDYKKRFTHYQPIIKPKPPIY